METNVQVDLINQTGGQGDVARMITNGRLDPGAMRPWFDVNSGKTFVTLYKGGDPKKEENYRNQEINTYGTLRPDEWKQLDAALIPIKENRLNGVNDLISRGLVYNLGNAMGTTVLEWHDISDALEATISMDAVTRGENDRVDFQANYLPIPIIHADYEINARELAVSRNLGNPLDTVMAERAARKVALKLEQMLFTNINYSFGGGTIYSYINYTNRNMVTLAKAWDATDVTGEEIVDDVITLKQTAIEALHFGPWQLYIPTNFETKLDKDYSTTKGVNTIRDRVLAIDGVAGIKVIDTLPTDNVLFVQMTPDVVRLVQGMPMQNIQWGVEGNMITKFKVMMIAVPQFRADQDGHCGVVHATFTST